MLKHILSITCSGRKNEKRKLLRHGKKKNTEAAEQSTSDTTSSSDLQKSVDLNEECIVHSPIDDISLESAVKEDRKTPIDFKATEVKDGFDIFGKQVSPNSNSQLVLSSNIAMNDHSKPPYIRFPKNATSASSSSSIEKRMTQINRSCPKDFKPYKNGSYNTIGGTRRMSNERVSTGSLSERLMLRTRRGSVKETLSKALRSTLRRSGKSTSDDSDEQDKCRRDNDSNNNKNVHSSHKSNRYENSKNSFKKNSKGYGSLTHLPPIQHRKVSCYQPENCMTQSMYAMSCSAFAPKTYTIDGRGSSMEDEEEYDYDDSRSMVSSASTSRLVAGNCGRFNSLHMFLSSPVRLRKTRRDALEAGFEPQEDVPRCHSTQSLKQQQPSQRRESFSNSQFRPSDISMDPAFRVVRASCDSTMNGNTSSRTRSNHDFLSEEAASHEERRRSLQVLNASGFKMTPSQFTPTRVDNGGRMRISSLNEMSETPLTHFSIGQRRSVHNIAATQRSSYVETKTKNKVAVAPLNHKVRNHSETRGSSSGINSFHLRNDGQERLVDGPINTADAARIAYLEKRVRELEFKLIEEGEMSSDVQELREELMAKQKKVAQLEGKLLKSYHKCERLGEDSNIRIKSLIFDSERARDDLTRCIAKIEQLESELELVRNSNENKCSEQELQDKVWKQQRELDELRSQLNRMKEKEVEYEKMKSEKSFLEASNHGLNKKLEANKKAMEELERSVSLLRIEQSVCKQSCSSGSTPFADEYEYTPEAKPTLYKPYTKAHSTMGSPMSHSKSTDLTKSYSNFALASASKNGDEVVSAYMSRTIREHSRYVTLCRAMSVCLRETLERLMNGEKPDVPRLLGVRMNAMSDSELDDDDEVAEESKLISMKDAENILAKLSRRMKELDDDLNQIRVMFTEWHSQAIHEDDGDREACRVQ